MERPLFLAPILQPPTLVMINRTSQISQINRTILKNRISLTNLNSQLINQVKRILRLISRPFQASTPLSLA
jgi:hypothetical protein